MPTIADVVLTLEGLVDVVETVDGLMAGTAETELTGIGTTFMASAAVLQRAQSQGLNLVITHEGPFYSHQGRADFLQEDSVYRTKVDFVKRSGVGIYRLHDHIHRMTPDGIVEGLIRALGWTAYVNAESASRWNMALKTPVLTMPTTTVGEVVSYVKRQLPVSFVRVMGDLHWPCGRVGLLPGYCGGGPLAIPFMRNADLDLIIVGEGPEWETPEYLRDAWFQGKRKAIMVIGHLESEQPGMQYLAEWLQPLFPSVPVEFLAGQSLFQVL